MNIGLALFNLIPIPPLDGSRVVDGLVPLRLRAQWEYVTRYSGVLLLLLIVGGRYVFAGPMGYVTDRIDDFIMLIAGY